MRHDELKKTWQPGQIWETLAENATQWVLVSDGGRKEPVWDERQEYRQHVPVGVTFNQVSSVAEALQKAEKAIMHAMEVVQSYEEGGLASESGVFLQQDLDEIRAYSRLLSGI